MLPRSNPIRSTDACVWERISGAFAAFGVRDRGGAAEHAVGNDGETGHPSVRRSGVFPRWGPAGQRGGSDDGLGKE